MLILSSSLTIVLLFLLSLLMPVMSFTLPIYKIKKMKNFSNKEKIIINVLVMGIISLINPLLLFFYIGFFLIIEFFYQLFNIKFYQVKKFDRIVIISIIVTLFMGLLLFLIKDEINNNINLLMEVYEKNLHLNKAESLEIFNGIKNSFLYYIFIYSILNIFMMYISLDLDDYSNWKISFEWLLMYIIGYFLIHLFKIDNFYINNIFDIGESIFIFFGIKTFYSMLSSKIKYKGINNMLAVMIALLFPFGTFILGVLGGFGIDKYIKSN